jgi:hypothetical protein
MERFSNEVRHRIFLKDLFVPDCLVDIPFGLSFVHPQPGIQNFQVQDGALINNSKE